MTAGYYSKSAVFVIQISNINRKMYRSAELFTSLMINMNYFENTYEIPNYNGCQFINIFS